MNFVALRWLSPLAALAAACSAASAPPAPSSPPAPPASSPLSAASTEPPAATSAAAGWQAVDPRAVRCGIDDTPRSVLGDNLAPGVDGPADESGVFSEERPRRAGLVPFLRVDRAFPEAKPAAPRRPPRPLVFFQQMPLRLLDGKPLPAPLAEAFSMSNPQYEICNNLAQDLPIEPVFELELTSTGAALRVSPTSPGQPSPYERCLMERACQLQARGAGLTAPIRVRVPVRASREPFAASPATAAGSEVRVDVMTENPSPQGAELQLQIRSAIADSARGCGAVAGRARVRFSVELSGPAGRKITGPSTRVAQVRTESLEGAAPGGVLGCIAGALQGRFFTGSLAPGVRAERALVTWNP